MNTRDAKVKLYDILIELKGNLQKAILVNKDAELTKELNKVYTQVVYAIDELLKELK